jgi:hypothetical protein
VAQAGAAAEQAIREGVARLQVEPSLLVHFFHFVVGLLFSFCCWFMISPHVPHAAHLFAVK